MFERLEAHMNLPLSNAVNPALASALHSVTTPAPAQGGALSNALGSASNLRDDFAQHFARIARQSQPRAMAPEPAPQRQQLAADPQHRPDARFRASQAHLSSEDAGKQADHPSAAKQPSPSKHTDDPLMAQDGADGPTSTAPSANKEPESASVKAPDSDTQANDAQDGTDPARADTATVAPADPSWSAMVPQGLQTLQISDRLQIITTAEPLPDPQSNAQFARSMGFDEQMIQRLFGTASQTGLGLMAGQVGDAATASAVAANPLLTPSTASASASALAAMVHSIATPAPSPADGSAPSKTVGDLLGLGAQTIQISDMETTTAVASAALNPPMPNVSTQNMLAMLSAFVPNANIDRLGREPSELLETIDLSSLASDAHGSPLNPNHPMGMRTHASGAAPASAATPASTDMAQTYQDLSDKLSTELAGRMHQQLNEGQWKMKFGLKPSHLGAVDVELEMRDGKLTAMINTDNATTQQLLNQGSSRLREALNGLGWSQAAVNIGQGQSSSAHTGHGQGQNTGPSGHGLNSGESANGLALDDAPTRSTRSSNALLDIYA